MHASTARLTRRMVGWLGVYLDVSGVDWEEIAEIVADAYRTVAPKRLVAALDDSGPGQPGGPGP